MSIEDAHFANSGKSQKVGKVAIVADGDAFRILLQYCPDIGGWPKHWFYEESDLTPGRLIVEFFKPFLLHLLAKKNLRRHRDHLWVPGGEVYSGPRFSDNKLRW